MTFTEDLGIFEFQDRHEVVFERVKLGNDIDKIDIQVENINGSMDHVLRFEECDFPGVSDLLDSSELNADIFKLEVLTETPEMDGEDEKCNYDYKGDIIFKNNRFGYLRTEVSKDSTTSS